MSSAFAKLIRAGWQLTAFSFAATAALAQAPASVAGFTYRAFYISQGSVQEESIDLYADGSFIERLGLVASTGSSSTATYRPTLGESAYGTYTYAAGSTTGYFSFSTPTTPPANPVPLQRTVTFSTENVGSEEGAPVTLLPSGGIASAQALMNMSTLIFAQAGSPISFGFVIGGSMPFREVLIRAVGPSLSQFGISNFAANPMYRLSGINFSLPGEKGQGWSATSASTSTLSFEGARAGAFPLVHGSTDKADAILLAPGAYTITVSPTDPSQEGYELVEVYEVE